MQGAAAAARASPPRTAARAPHSFPPSPSRAPAPVLVSAAAHRHRSIRLLPPTHDSLAADLQQRLAGRYIAECGGSGNCLFHTLSFLAYDRPDEHRQLRSAVADFFADEKHAQHPVVRRLRAELRLQPAELGGVDQQPIRTVAEYAAFIRRNGVQGSTVYELPVLAELLELEVHVVLQLQVPCESAAAEQLRDHVVQLPASVVPLRRVDMLYVNENGACHFQALVSPEDVPALVAACCKCKGRCLCDPANHLYYNLSVGLGLSQQRFARQRKAIAAELEHSRYTRTLAAMPYHVRTVAPKASCPQPVATRLGPSNLGLQAAGEAVLLGVFPQHGQPAMTAALQQSRADHARRARFVTHYGGWLIPDTLLDQLQHRVYICTAVSVDALAYENPKNGQRVAVCMVGNPESTGPQLNDGRISQQAVNCCLASVDAADLSSVRTLVDGKYAIGHDAVRVERLRSGEIPTWEELLVSYDTSAEGQDGYWTRQAAAASHCLMCFRLDFAKGDQLLQCEVDGCKVARHRLCLPAPDPADPSSQLITEAIARRTRFRCAPHLLAAKQADPKLRVSSPAPRSGVCLPTVAERMGLQAAAAAAAAAQAEGTGTAAARARDPGAAGARGEAPTASRLCVPRQTGEKHVSVASLCTPPRPHAPSAEEASARQQQGEDGLFRPPRRPIPPRGLEDLPSAQRAASSRPPHATQYSWQSSAGPSSVPARASALAKVFGSGQTPRREGAVPQPDSTAFTPSIASVASSDPRAAPAAAAAAPAAAPAALDPDLDLDQFHEEDVNSDWGDGNWSAAESPDDSGDSEDGDARMTRKIIRQVEKATRFAEHSARDPLTGELSRHRALSVRSASRAHPASATLTAAQQDEEEAHRVVITTTAEQEIRRLLNARVAGKPRGQAPWFLRKELPQLLHWDEYRKQEASDRHDVEAQAALKAELRRAQAGRTLWLSALQIAKDWQEYSRCCGNLKGGSAHTARLLRHLSGSTVATRTTHASTSIVHFMAKRIEKRAAFSSKQEFTSHVCQELEASVQAPVAATGEAQVPLVGWDGCPVCHSCYRAALGIGRTSLFKFKAQLNLRANVRLLEKAEVDARREHDPSAKHLPHLIRLAQRAADRPIYSQRAESSRDLVKALLLAYCQSFAQHDPGAAGSTVMRTRYTLPQHGVTALHSALNADLADRVLTQRQLDPNKSDLPLPKAADADPKTGHHFSKSTLQRVIDHLEKQCHVTIQLTKHKGVCRCTQCDDLQARIAHTAVGSPERQILQAQLSSHLDTAKAQRQLFDERKAEAMKKPGELWTITFDGFDKSKTALPHRPRFNKEQGLHVDSLIGMHVVGVFAFGAPEPVLAFFNDESVAGGANLSATIVFEVLEKQWQKLVRDYLQQRNPTVAPEHLDQLDVSPEQLSDAHAYAASKWPRRLHLTFDNTSGEAKNTTFFKAMAALVHYGVFEAITMSMLLVGHTHDIVDQMFSVWAVVLRITSVPTLQALKDLFRRCYRTRLKALSELFAQGEALFDPPQQPYDEHGQELPVPEAAAKTAQLKERLEQLNLFSLEALQTFFRESVQDRHDPGNPRTKKWQKDDFDFAAQTMHELESVNPELYDIAHTIDFDGWFKSNAASLGSAQMTHLSKSYVFAIEKRPADAPPEQGEGAAGNTYLFTRFLANTIAEAQAFPEQRHSYLRQITGEYSTRKLIFPAAGEFRVPPRRTLARVVDSAAIELMLSVFAKDGLWLTPLEYAANRAQLQGMQDKAAAQAAACVECSGVMERLKAIGPISRKDTHTPAEKKLATEKQTKKTAVLHAYREHMLDDAYADSHSPLVLTRFWGMWVDRRDAIQRSFQARHAEGSLQQLRLQMSRTPYHRHPPELCSDRWEPSIFPDDERIDVRCLRANGPPQVNHIAVLRTNDINDAFLLGRITALHPDSAAEAQRLHLRTDQRLMIAFRQQEPGIMRIQTPALHPRLLKMDARDTELLQRMQEVRRRALGLGTDDPLPLPPFEIRASHLASSPVGAPCSVGAFATRRIREGEFLDFYSIFVTHKTEYYQDHTKSRTHVANIPNSDEVLDGLPMASAITRFVSESEDAQARMKMLPASAFEPLAMFGHMALSNPAIAGVLRRFGDLPKGSLINSAYRLGPHRKNCARVSNERDFTQAGGSRMMHPLANVPYLQASRDIDKGEELLCQYNNKEEKTGEWRVAPSDAPPGAAAAVETVRDQLVAHARAQDDENDRCDLSLLPDMTIQFFHYYAKDMTSLGYTSAFWKRQWAEHFAQLERAQPGAAAAAAASQQEQQHSAAAASADSVAAAHLSASGLTAAQLSIAASELKPPWLVDAFKPIHFLPSANHRSSRTDARQVAAATLLYWGPPAKVLAGHPYVKLKDKVFHEVRAHLTGGREGAGAAAAAAHAAAAGRGARAKGAAAAAREGAEPAPGAPRPAAKRKQQRKKKVLPAHAAEASDSPDKGEYAAAAAAAGSSAPASGSKKRRAAAAAAESVSCQAPLSRKSRGRTYPQIGGSARKDRYRSSDSDESSSAEEMDISSEESEEEHFSEHSEGSCSSADEDEPLSRLLGRQKDLAYVECIHRHQAEKGVMWYLVKWDGSPLNDTPDSPDWFKRDDLPSDMADAYDHDHHIGNGTIARALSKRQCRGR